GASAAPFLGDCRARTRRPAPACNDEHAGRTFWRLDEGRGALCRSSPYQSAATARGTVARGRESAGQTALGNVRDRGARGQYHPADGRGRGRGRGRLAVAVLYARRHVEGH